MRVLLISTYDLGRQPAGLASPAAWLRGAGVDVECVDVSRDTLHDGQIAERGTHRQLLEAGGRYAAMYRRELLEAELTEE